MIHDQFKVDNIDLVCLIAACMKANELPEHLPEGEVMRVTVGDLGELYTAARQALEFISVMHRENPDDWDGVVWYELLCDASVGSLADWLVDRVMTKGCDMSDIRPVVIEWLNNVGI